MDQAYQKLGELLLSRNLISPAQLEDALKLQAASGLRLGEVLVRHGFVQEGAVAGALAAQYGYEVVDPKDVFPTPEALEIISFGEAASNCLLPVRTDDESIFCLVADPLNVPITDQLAQKHKKRVMLAVASDTQLKARILEAYRGDMPMTASGSSIKVPERFCRATPRHHSESAVWIDAHDSFLDRPVSLVMVPLESDHKDSHLTNLRAAAKFVDSHLAVVHDTFSFETWRVSVLERLAGVQLSDNLKTGSRLSPADSAKIVSQFSRVAGQLSTGDSSWICPENVWMNGSEIKLAPVFSGGAHRRSTEVEALGNLLWQCLLGRHGGEFDVNSHQAEMIPSGMLVILDRCLSPQEDQYRSPKEIYNTLATFRWSSETQGAPVAAVEMDRDELLSTLRISRGGEKPSIWRRLFGRRAA